MKVKYLAAYCFSGAYILTLLTEGYNFTSLSYSSIRFIKKVGGGGSHTRGGASVCVCVCVSDCSRPQPPGHTHTYTETPDKRPLANRMQLLSTRTGANHGAN